MFTAIKQRKLSVVVLEQIKKVISDGSIKPGERLPGERTLAEELGVSRPPVRDAIKELIFRGYLETRGNATYVKSLTGVLLPDTLKEHVATSGNAFQELAEIREVLEGWAASKAAVSRTEKQLAHMKQIVQHMENPSKADKMTALDLDFHRTLAEMVGNTLFMHQIQSIAEVMIPIVSQYRETILTTEKEKAFLLEHHRTIYEQIRDRNPDGAKTAMVEHINYTKSAKPLDAK